MLSSSQILDIFSRDIKLLGFTNGLLWDKRQRVKNNAKVLAIISEEELFVIKK